MSFKTISDDINTRIYNHILEIDCHPSWIDNEDAWKGLPDSKMKHFGIYEPIPDNEAGVHVVMYNPDVITKAVFTLKMSDDEMDLYLITLEWLLDTMIGWSEETPNLKDRYDWAEEQLYKEAPDSLRHLTSVQMAMLDMEKA